MVAYRGDIQYLYDHCYQKQRFEAILSSLPAFVVQASNFALKADLETS